MNLVRVGNAACSSPADTVHARDDEVVQAVFRNFGLGSEKTSDFRVEINWDDMEELLKHFVLRHHSRATALLDAHSLAIAARRAGWVPKD